MDRIYDVIIVGGGPGGYAAALYCSRANLSTLVIEKLSAGGQMATAPLVENYPGFDEGIEGFTLAEHMQRGAHRFGAMTEYAEAIALDLKAEPKVVRTTQGVYQAKAVILAMGATPRELGVPDEETYRGRGVAYCAACDGMFYKGKTVAVAGGGNTAVADALTLANLCEKVYIVHRRETLRATPVYMEKLEQAGNIEIIWNSMIQGFLFDEGFKGVKIRNTQTEAISELACDGVFVALGRVPDSGMAAGQVDMDDQGYIIADETTRTSIPGVFAVGDMRTKRLRQIITAAADGACAAHFAETYLQSI